MVMPDRPAASSDREEIERQSVRWLLALSDRELSGDEARAFEAWLGHSPDHVAIFRRQEAAWRNLPHIGGVAGYRDLVKPSLYERIANAAYALHERLRGFTERQPIWPSAGAAVAFLVAAVVVTTWLTVIGPSDRQRPLFTTQIAETRQLTLDDGSKVTLGAASALDTAFTAAERRVMLSRGEAFFEVTKNPNRPFVVQTPQGLVRVVGTRFDVRLGAGGVRVAVSQGRVEVLQPQDDTAAMKDADVRHVLLAGQSVVTSKAGKLQPIVPVVPAEVASWRQGVLVYVDTPLRDILADLNRYRREPVELSDPALGCTEFTASFTTGQAASQLAMIEDALGLKEQKGTGRVVLTRTGTGN